METVETIQCTGCEMECEVCVTILGGEIISVDGNNCPTGRIFACSQCTAKAPDDSHGGTVDPPVH